MSKKEREEFIPQQISCIINTCVKVKNCYLLEGGGNHALFFLNVNTLYFSNFKIKISVSHKRFFLLHNFMHLWYLWMCNFIYSAISKAQNAFFFFLCLTCITTHIEFNHNLKIHCIGWLANHFTFLVNYLCLPLYKCDLVHQVSVLTLQLITILSSWSNQPNNKLQKDL